MKDQSTRADGRAEPCLTTSGEAVTDGVSHFRLPHTWYAIRRLVGNAMWGLSNQPEHDTPIGVQATLGLVGYKPGTAGVKTFCRQILLLASQPF